MKTINRYVVIALVLSVGLFSACSKEDLDPTLAQNQNIEGGISTVADLQNVINGAYERMASPDYYGRDFIILGEVFSANCTSNGNSNRFVLEAQMDLLPPDAIAETLWQQAYQVIAQANIVISKAPDVTGDAAVINQVLGEALAMRALAHFNLLQFYGQQHVNGGGLSALGVPFVTTFRDDENLSPARNTVQEVRDFIYADLQEAESLMAENNNRGAAYISTYAVDAIQARVANYFGDWQISFDNANEVISSGAFSVASAQDFISNFVDDVDGAGNVIFEISNSPVDNPNIDGLYYLYGETNYGDIVVLPNLEGIYGTDDVRGLGGVITSEASGLRNTVKYSKPDYSSNIPVIRYEEMVLIKAEALFELGTNTTLGLTLLNSIPTNRDVPSANLYTALTKQNILLERRKEFAFEGMRFHDLARTGQDVSGVDAPANTHGLVTYGDTHFAMPIPAAEVGANGNVVQNAGY